jgi:branched-chain amino acid transport system permease protein
MIRRTPIVLAYVGALVIALQLPHLLSTSMLVAASESLIFAVAGLSVVIISGWTGQTSLAQVSLMGVAAYVLALLMGPDAGLPLYVAAPVAILAACTASVMIGLPALRVRGVYLAIVTLAFAQVMEDAVFLSSRVTHGQVSDGLALPRPVIGALDLRSDRTMYYLIVAALVVCCAAVAMLRNSSLGRQMIAVRATEVGASGRGVSLTVVKLLAFVVSAGFAGLAGCLLALYLQSVGPTNFDPLQSIFLLGVVVVCGGRTVGAAIAGGALYGSMPVVLSRIFGTGSSVGINAPHLIIGIGVVAILVAREVLVRHPLALPHWGVAWGGSRPRSQEGLTDVPA